MGQDQIVTITPDGATVIGFDGSPAQATPFDVTWDAAAADKGGYATYMDKEIHDQPHAVAATLLGRTDPTGALTLERHPGEAPVRLQTIDAHARTFAHSSVTSSITASSRRTS